MSPPSSHDNRLVCQRCSYEWVPRKDQLPKRCPRCRSVKWNDANLRVTCARCGHTWNSHDGSPRRCPACGSHQWDVPPVSYTCKRCGNYWAARGSKVPRRCPACGSRAWDQEPEEGPVRERDPGDAGVERAVLAAYRRGEGCLDISISTGLPYSVVRGIVVRDNPGNEPRV